MIRPRPEPWIVRHVERWSIIAAIVVCGLLWKASEAAEKPNSATVGETCKLLVSGQDTGWTAPAGSVCENACDVELERRRSLAAPTKTSGSVRYTCRNDRSTTVSYQANPTCPGYSHLPTTRTQACPAGTAGSWEQRATHVQRPHPDCTVDTSWAPTLPPAGSCPPIVVEPEPRTATLSWTPGAPVPNATVVGYRINYGLSPTMLIYAVDVAGTRHVIEALPATGTWYFGVRSLTSDGRQSALSNIQSKQVR